MTFPEQDGPWRMVRSVAKLLPATMSKETRAEYVAKKIGTRDPMTCLEVVNKY